MGTNRPMMAIRSVWSLTPMLCLKRPFNDVFDRKGLRSNPNSTVFILEAGAIRYFFESSLFCVSLMAIITPVALAKKYSINKKIHDFVLLK